MSKQLDTIPCPACDDGLVNIMLDDRSTYEGPCPVCNGTRRSVDMGKIKAMVMGLLDVD